MIADRIAILFAPRPRTAEAWLARLARPGIGARDQALFRAWLEADPDHLAQYEQLKADQAALAGLHSVFSGDLVRLRQRPHVHSTATPRRLVLAGGLALAGVAATVALIPTLGGFPEGQLHESAPGQIMDVTLEDGTRVTLDTASAVRVAFAAERRKVILERGAAYFDVAHDATRPFAVEVADRQVIVTGTRFATALVGDRAEVSLLEGGIVIRRSGLPGTAPERDVVLVPGEQAVFGTGETGIRTTRADVDAVTAWSRRRLVFRDTPLPIVIAAAARYADAPLVLADPRLEEVRVTVILPLEGEDDLPERMTRLLPIEIERSSNGQILIRGERG